MAKRIVIIGGGYAGSELARRLENRADVTLIEQRSHFTHAPAMIRAIVDPRLLERALIPYGKLLKRGKVIRARASEVDGTGVTLADGQRVPADYIVIATGSAYAAPFKAQGEDIHTLRAANARVHEALVAAKTIAIVGGGAVGTELAGEITHALPGKAVTLITEQRSLFPGFPPKLGHALRRKLEAAGMKIVLGTRVEDLQSVSEPYSGAVTLDDGRRIEADLIFPVVGARAQSDLVASLPGVRKGTANRFKVDKWMRPSDLPNVFAAGDAAEMGDEMTIVAVTRQVPWLAKTLGKLIEGKQLEQLKPYTPWSKAPIMIPLGPEKGNSFLSLFTAGDWLTRSLKGKDLFLPRYNKAFGRI